MTESDDCFHCSLAGVCLAGGLGEADTRTLSDHMSRQVRHPRQYLCRAGDRSPGIFIIRTGIVKRFRPLQTEGRNFREIIVDFPARGDLVGLEAIGQDVNSYSAQTLETCSLCHLPSDRLDSLLRLMPDKIRDIVRMSLSLCVDPGYRNVIKQPEERVAGFLLDIARKSHLSGMSRLSFSLPMQRQEIADHLVIATETLSRVLGKLKNSGIIAVRGRNVRIIEPEKLLEIALDGQQKRAHG